LLLKTESASLIYINSNASFEINISIKAELANYTFKIYGSNTSNTIYELNKTISNIVAGDVYIIQGQSNAVASIRSGSANENKSDYIRSYSSGTVYSSSLLSNDSWYIADGDVGIESNGNIGQWGLKLARILMDDLQIPIAIFNGANGAKTISYFQAPSDYKTSLNSNYGRLYYRLDKTGLKNYVKAVLWSQGEANAINNYISVSEYKNYFIKLKNSWLNDYPNLNNIYIFQTKDCNCGTISEGKMNVKEAQRQLASEMPGLLSIIPTTSLSIYSDNCHFPFTNGYESFATRIHKLVLHDIYGKSFSEEINAPMIKSVEFIAPNTLVIETDAIDLKFSSTDQATMLNRLKQDFELRNVNNVSITDVSLSGNKILFRLSGDPGTNGNISFIGYNSNIGYTITNSSDLELISFSYFPIKNSTYTYSNNSFNPVIENTSICNYIGALATINVIFPNPNASYIWFFKIPGGDFTPITSLNAGSTYSNYNSPSLEIKKSSTLPDLGAVYKVVVNNGFLGDFTSNEVVLNVNAISVSKSISGASAVCIGGSKTLTYGTGSVGTIQWQSSTVSSLSNFVDIVGENAEVFTATNLQKTTWFRVRNSSGVCSDVYCPAVQVIVNSVPVPGYILGGNVNVCKTNNSTVLSLNNYEGTIQWQKSTTSTGVFYNIPLANSDTYIASALTVPTYYRAILNSGVCSLYTEIVIINIDPIPVNKVITGATSICNGGSITLTYGTGSVGAIQWQSSTDSNSANFVDIVGETSEIFTASNLQQTTWFRVRNSSGSCSSTYSQAVQVIVNPLPIAGYIIGGNINVCKNTNSTLLSLNNYVGTIQWQKATTLTGIYSNISLATSANFTTSALTSTTYYRAAISNGICNTVYSSSVQIGVNALPIFNPIGPICFGSQISPLPNTSLNGIIGSWSPEFNNTLTTEYTFTPNIGFCSPSTKMTISVMETLPPIGSPIQIFNNNITNYISDLLAIGTNVFWYDSIENAKANISVLEPNTPIIIGNTYYAVQTINGCPSSPLAVKTFLNLDITDFDSKELQFYPNPVQDSFTLNYPEIISEINLFNCIGQSVFFANPKSINPTFNINYLPVGTYFMEVKSKNKKDIIKLIKK
jgi:hypothetical protein